MTVKRPKLGVLLMEEDDGKVAVELFKDPDSAFETFSNLKGRPGDKESRATFLEIDWDKKVVVRFEVRDLPQKRDHENEPWGYKLGVGPMEEPKEFTEQV